MSKSIGFADSYRPRCEVAVHAKEQVARSPVEGNAAAVPQTPPEGIPELK